MQWRRFVTHLFTSRRQLARAFPAATLDAIEREITRVETDHSGEIRVAIEAALDPREALAGRTPRDRALEVFALLGVWDTEANNGVLIYILLADHDVEIVADRGYNDCVTAQSWSRVCNAMRRAFAEGDYESAVLAGVTGAGELIAMHFPPAALDRDELPNRPTLL